MYNVRIKSPKKCMIYYLQGEEINLSSNHAREMHWGFVRGWRQCPQSVSIRG